MNPPKPEDHEFATKQYKKLAELLAAGQFKPNPVKKYPNGLAGVEQGFKDAQAGKVNPSPIRTDHRFEPQKQSTSSQKQHKLLDIRIQVDI